MQPIVVRMRSASIVDLDHFALDHFVERQLIHDQPPITKLTASLNSSQVVTMTMTPITYSNLFMFRSLRCRQDCLNSALS